MKKTSKKLRLDIETIQALVHDTLRDVHGGQVGSHNGTCSCVESCVGCETTGVIVPGPTKITGRI